jgi:hypothetical protein
MSLTKLSLGGNYDVINKLFLPSKSLLSDIPAGDGNIEKLFLQCISIFCCAGKLKKTDVSMPVRMHLALDNENEPAWVEVKNLKDVVGGVSPTSQVIAHPQAISLGPGGYKEMSSILADQ